VRRFALLGPDAEVVHRQDAGKQNSAVRWNGLLQVDPGELHHALKHGWQHDGVDGWLLDINKRTGRVRLRNKPNLVVDTGVTRVQNLGWGIGGVTQVVNCMGVDNGTSNPAAGTTSVASDGTATSCRIQAFDATATQTTKVVSQTATYNQGTVAFVMKRLSLSFIASGSLPVTATASVPANSLHSMTNVFTIDLTIFSTWSQAFTATVTGTGS
jgi:hypothetical protein